MIRITLGNGKVLNNLKQDGNNYVSAEALSESDFAGGLDGVKIEYTLPIDDEGHEETVTEMHDHMKLLYCRQIYGHTGYYFVIEDYSPAEMKELSVESRIAYLEMITEEADGDA